MDRQKKGLTVRCPAFLDLGQHIIQIPIITTFKLHLWGLSLKKIAKVVLMGFLSAYHKLFFKLGFNLQTKSHLTLDYKWTQISKIRSIELDSPNQNCKMNDLILWSSSTPTDISKNLNSEFNFSALEIRSLVQVPKYRRVATFLFFSFLSYLGLVYKAGSSFISCKRTLQNLVQDLNLVSRHKIQGWTEPWLQSPAICRGNLSLLF